MLARHSRLLSFWRAELLRRGSAPARSQLGQAPPPDAPPEQIQQQGRSFAVPAYAPVEELQRHHRQQEGGSAGPSGSADPAGLSVPQSPAQGQPAAWPPERDSASSSSGCSSSEASQGRRAAGRPLPSLAEVRQQLRPQGAAPGGGCGTSGGGAAPPGGSSAPPAGLQSAPPALHWRALLDRLSQEQLEARGPLPGEEMLTDTFGRRHTYLRVSLTERCNLRCTYCMPAEGVELAPREALLTNEEVLRLAALFAEAGVTKIRLTGGEPTLRRELAPLVASLRALPGVADVGLTTNGLTLARQLPELQAAGLSLLNISLDTLRPERFEAMTRRRGLDRVLGAISTAVELGYDPVKVNVVVMRGVNEDEIPAFVGLTRDRPLNVRFIEYMPFDGNVWAAPKLVPFAEMRRAVLRAFPAGLEPLQDPRGEVAKNFRVLGHRGSVSFVTSMTAAFCGDCNRLRLLADGNLKVCLFGASEVSLRDALRGGASDAELRAVVAAAVARKRAAHAGMAALAGTANRAMVKIGG